jgi:CelD/BcsL family acetyltransferase involved in cellulose biosynthesis
MLIVITLKKKNKRYETRTDKKFETVGKLKLTEEQKAYNLQQLKKLKRKKLLTQAKKKASDKLY